VSDDTPVVVGNNIATKADVIQIRNEIMVFVSNINQVLQDYIYNMREISTGEMRVLIDRLNQPLANISYDISKVDDHLSGLTREILQDVEPALSRIEVALSTLSTQAGIKLDTIIAMLNTGRDDLAEAFTVNTNLIIDEIRINISRIVDNSDELKTEIKTAISESTAALTESVNGGIRHLTGVMTANTKEITDMVSAGQTELQETLKTDKEDIISTFEKRLTELYTLIAESNTNISEMLKTIQEILTSMMTIDNEAIITAQVQSIRNQVEVAKRLQRGLMQ